MGSQHQAIFRILATQINQNAAFGGNTGGVSQLFKGLLNPEGGFLRVAGSLL